jgi:hypothetical protein
MKNEDNSVDSTKSGAEKPKSDFEKYIEDALEDADMKPDEEANKEQIEDVISRRNGTIETLTPSTKQIAEIISQNELIEQAKQERVRAILDKQIRIYERKLEILERLEKEMATLKTKSKVSKAALKKAKGVKLEKQVIGLIKTDIGYIDEAVERCREMIKKENKDIKKIASLINLLDSAT